MKEGARVHHSYGSYAPSTYDSYGPRKTNLSTALELLQLMQLSRYFRFGNISKTTHVAQDPRKSVCEKLE